MSFIGSRLADFLRRVKRLLYARLKYSNNASQVTTCSVAAELEAAVPGAVHFELVREYGLATDCMRYPGCVARCQSGTKRR